MAVNAPTRPLINRMRRGRHGLFARVLDQVPTPMLVVDARGTAVWQNDARRNLFGTSDDEQTIGRYNLRRDPLIREQGHLADLKEVFENAAAVRFAINCDLPRAPNIRASGTTHSILDVTVSPIADGDGQLLGAVVHYADITDQKQMEEELRRARNELELLLSSISSILIRVNEEGTITRWNTPAEETFGVSSSVAVGRPFSECVIPYDFGQLLDGASEALRTGQEIRVDDISFKRADGSDGYLGITITPTKGESETSSGFVLRGRDITAHKLSAQALEERTRDLGERVKELNFLYTMSTLVERPHLSLKEMLHALLDLIPLALRYRDEVRARIIVGDQTLTTSNFSESPWRYVCDISFQGELLGTIEVFYVEEKPDVNDGPFLKGEKDLLCEAAARIGEVISRRRAEKALREAQRHLLQSEKLASIGQLAAGVAHEINNPVGFVSSNLRTLQEYTLTFKEVLSLYAKLGEAIRASDRAKQLDLIGRAEELSKLEDLPYIINDVDKLLGESKEGTDRIRDIVRNLKSFARADEEEIEEADINEGIEATLKIVWNELKYKCEVHKNLRHIPKIRCYPGQLNQVFMNLLVNAAQAIPEHGDISIETGVAEGEVTVRVSDTGIGISPENMSKVFDPFFTTKGVGKGTGLGLSISHGIIQKHHGRIDVESEPGRGTTFMVRLPIDGLQDE